MEVQPGIILEGYEFMEAIGEGSYSSVYRVRSRQFDRPFVAKVTRVKNENTEKAWQAFDSEIQALLRLDHPNIIKLYGHFRYGDNFILILEYCSNGSLSDYISNQGAVHGRFLVAAVRDICGALNYAWSCGVQHRDIKPANIMLDDNWRVKLADFGISTTRKIKAKSSVVSDFKCSKVCAAPEILRKVPYDPVKSDIWAVGVTILWMVKGAVPWRCTKVDDLTRMVQNKEYTIPMRMEATVAVLVQRMLMVNPDERVFPTDEELGRWKPTVRLPHRLSGPSHSALPNDGLPCQSFQAPGQRRILSSAIRDSMQTRRSSGALVAAALMRLPSHAKLLNTAHESGRVIAPEMTFDE